MKSKKIMQQQIDFLVAWNKDSINTVFEQYADIAELKQTIIRLEEFNTKLAEENHGLRTRVAAFKTRMNSAYGRYEEWIKAESAKKPVVLFDVNSLYPAEYTSEPTELAKRVKDLKPGDIVHLGLNHRTVEWVAELPTGDYDVCLKHPSYSNIIITCVHNAELSVCDG